MPLQFRFGVRTQHREFHFEFGDADVLLDRRSNGLRIRRVGAGFPVRSQFLTGRNPAVALAQKTDKERRKVAAPVDFSEADFDCRAIFRVLFGDTPAQIDLGKADIASETGRPNFGKHVLREIGAFALHIVESTGEKHADFTRRRLGSRHFVFRACG
ncbi:hypothetical protein LJ656_24930 [Paraburkholderia sp. MMS20-SJTR3]|uniref:Uncharacterized protein n=1 Tax=Paraburkholderia sejongensis TaxID=2886946 RepID=A0ABS8K129_9BURK|nr:hypothetical protein [Paraburkholderia sp. MMS20-SJTR3]MCC8395834.1 hypothetical protein [Paraburkholderia sp. MMS20-SJTR3]